MRVLAASLSFLYRSLRPLDHESRSLLRMKMYLRQIAKLSGVKLAIWPTFSKQLSGRYLEFDLVISRRQQLVAQAPKENQPQ